MIKYCFLLLFKKFVVVGSVEMLLDVYPELYVIFISCKSFFSYVDMYTAKGTLFLLIRNENVIFI